MALAPRAEIAGDGAGRSAEMKWPSFEVYEGTHTSKVADRIQNHVIPFFSQHLCFEAACR